MIAVYGIPNCQSVQKTRAFLEQAGVQYTFHDFKKTPPEIALLQHWQETLGLERLINRKGTTWRGLSELDKAKTASADSAIELLKNHTSLIKRPVVVVHNGSDKRLWVGHDEALLQLLTTPSLLESPIK